MSINPHIVPFTERALLNNTVLDLIHPTNCEKNKVAQTDQSLESVFTKSAWHFDYGTKLNGPKTDTWFVIGQPLRAVMRVVYVASILLVISPAGAIYHGGTAGVLYLKHAFKTRIQAKPTDLVLWDKIQKYSHAAFSDLRSFSIGLLMPTLFIFIPFGYGYFLTTIAPTLTLTSRIAIGTLMSFPAIASFILIGGDFSRSIANNYLGCEKSASMYLALELRNQLGLVDQHGHLLKFADDEIKFEFNETNQLLYAGQSNILCLLDSTLKEAEREIIEKATKWIKKRNLALKAKADDLTFDQTGKLNWIQSRLLQIEFPKVLENNIISHKLNGYEIAKILEQTITAENNEFNEQTVKWIQKLSNMQYTFDTLKNIWSTAMDISLIKIRNNPETNADQKHIADYYKKYELPKWNQVWTFQDNYMQTVNHWAAKHNRVLNECQNFEDSSDTSSEEESSTEEQNLVPRIILPENIQRQLPAISGEGQPERPPVRLAEKIRDYISALVLFHERRSSPHFTQSIFN